MANLLAVTYSLLTGSPLLTGAITYRPVPKALGVVGCASVRYITVICGGVWGGSAFLVVFRAKERLTSSHGHGLAHERRLK